MNQPIKNHNGLCWKCLQNFHPDNIIQITIPAIGYGSQFDTFSTKLQLCKECINKTNKLWWKLNTIKCQSDCVILWSAYEYEEEIINFIESLPICSQELFYNSCSNIYNKLNPHDWLNEK